MKVLSILLNIVSCILFIVLGWKLSEFSLSWYHIVLLVLTGLLGFLSKFTNHIYLDMSEILKKYKDKLNMTSTFKSILNLHRVNFIFGIFTGPLYSLSLCFLVGFLTSGFRNLIFLSYLLFCIGFYIIGSSMVSSFLGITTNNILNLFQENRELYFDSINNNNNYMSVIAFEFRKNYSNLATEYESVVVDNYNDDYTDLNTNESIDNIYVEGNSQSSNEDAEEFFITSEDENIYAEKNIYADDEDEEEFEI